MTLPGLILRRVVASDLDDYFEHQRDPRARWMAAFGAADPDNRGAFDAHWQAVLAHPDVRVRTVARDGLVLGHVMAYALGDQRQVGFWVGAAYWGCGVATAALAMFLAEDTERPLQGRAAADNVASLRVLQRCGFVECARERAYAPARAMVIDELVLRLDV